jgi:crotonobetainyl-CoA:carnitine CoA-transferase CaiB-like acyl-CoA transferase
MDSVLDEAFNDLHMRWEASDLVDDLTEQVTRPRTKLEIFVEGQRRGIPTTPVNTVADLRSDPHLQSVRFWRDDHHPVLRTLSSPGAPFRVNRDWWHWTPAPALGEHTAEELDFARS